MGILQGLERRLRGAVDTTFARIFGGSVQPAEVTAALQHEAALRVTHQSGRAIAPNRYTVELGPADSADVGDDIRRVSAALSTSLGEYVHEQGWDTYAPVQVTLRESPRLHTGQFRISSIVDPSVAAPRPAGVSSEYDAAAGHAHAGPVSRGPGHAAVGPPPYGQGHSQAPIAASGAGYPDVYPEPSYGQPGYGQPGYGQPPHPGYGQPGYHQPPPGYAPPAPQPYPDNAGYPYAPPDNDPRPLPPDVAAPPTLIVQDGTGRSYPLRRGSNVVGRGQDAALRLADTAVSREHIDVYFDGRIAIVHDLGSTNGTIVNGAPIQTWQLADGDVIRLGTSTVVYSAR
jgi:hypothetical protein